MMNIDAKETIVLAEDSPPNRRILAHLLTKLGFNVVACEHGEAALAALNSIEHAGVVLLITDIMMPVMDGLNLLSKVRESENWKTLPVVLITAVSENEYITRAKDLHVNGYILKPVTYERVRAKMAELFPNKNFPKLSA